MKFVIKTCLFESVLIKKKSVSNFIVLSFLVNVSNSFIFDGLY